MTFPMTTLKTSRELGNVMAKPTATATAPSTRFLSALFRSPVVILARAAIGLLVLTLIQDTLSLYFAHATFSRLALCTDPQERLSGGPYAEEHCAHHEHFVQNPLRIGNWAHMFWEANFSTAKVLSFVMGMLGVPTPM